MDPNLIVSVNQLLDKQDTTIAMLQAVVRAIYDNGGIGTQERTTGPVSVSTTSTNVSIPIPLPVIWAGGNFEVSITNQPLSVQATQAGVWNVGIVGQPIQVTFTSPTYKYTIINANSAGDTTVVSAVTNKKIRVVAFAVVAAGTVDVRFKSGNTDITGSMRLLEAGGIAHAFEGGLFETAVNQALLINLSSSVQVGGYVVYQEV